MRRRLVTAIGVLALVVGACSTPPTAEEGTTTAAQPGTTGEGTPTTAADEGTTTTAEPMGLDNRAALEEVYAQVEGLTGEERTARLLELAQEEEALSIYGSTNLEDALPLFEAFEDLYDLEPSYYRASSGDVLTRILQEADANFAGNDVVMANGPELAILDEQGLLLPLETPTTENIIDAGVFDTWAAIYMNSFIAAWNTDFVSGDVPDNWNDFLSTFDGALALELGDWDWFATLTRRYFIAELGMTEEEVVELFKNAVAGSTVVDGHTLMAELLVAGEYDAATSLYHHRVTEMISEGAPLQWEPPVRPIIVRPNGVGIMRHVQSPASALLWVEFMLTDGQEVLAAEYRGPASTQVAGGIPEEYAPILVDLEAIAAERDKWESLWEEIVQAAGTEPVGD
ncbi:MAG TPA: ABC transporter substrate-binding protein [Acidimicrobiia bacterium]|nr:ABC transporter substrate-binding protein [Acidimicrobiia bacterium]